MELRRYLAIVRAHWVLAATALGVTILATLYLVMPQPWIYEASGSLRVQPSDEIRTQEDLIRAWANLSEPKVTTTYATLIQSDLITDQAESTLPDTSDTAGLNVHAQVLIDTTIITVTTTGQDAETVRDMTDAVMTQAVLYADGVDATYQLERVDEPALPDGPVGPNKNLQLILGLLFGAILAIAIALFAEYVRRPVEDFAITDAATGASNELYLRHRLREETARTVRTNEPFVVATLRVEVRTGENDDMAHVPADRDLRRIARGLRLTIPDDAVIAYLGGGLFAALIPGIERGQIDGTIGSWGAAVGALLDWSSHGELGRRLQLGSGVCEFRGQEASGSPDVEKLVTKLIGEMHLEDLVGEAEPEVTPEPGPELDATPEPEVAARPPVVAKPAQVAEKPTVTAKPAVMAKPTPEAKPETAPVAKPTPETVPVAKSETTPAAPAMPPAPARTTTKPRTRPKPGNGNGGAPAKKQVRRITVLPEIEDMRTPTDEPAEPAVTGAPKTGAQPAKDAGQEKGDAGDPAD